MRKGIIIITTPNNNANSFLSFFLPSFFLRSGYDAHQAVLGPHEEQLPQRQQHRARHIQPALGDPHALPVEEIRLAQP